MHIALKKGGKIYINGAVIRVDRKVNIELLNEATFLLDSHLMEPDEANTPLKQIYYVLQSAMINPSSSGSVKQLLRVMSEALKSTNIKNQAVQLDEVSRLCNESRYYEALKRLKTLMSDQIGSAVEKPERRLTGVSA